MPPSTQSPERNASTPKLSREQIIRAVQTPLGFFSLVVLVVEAMLGVLAGLSSGPQRTFLISSILILIALLVLVVAFLAYKRPEVLNASTNPVQTNIAQQLDRIEEELQRLDRIGRYTSGTLVASLFGLQDKVKVRAHCHAGGLTITPILLEDLPKAARGFYEMLRGDKDELKLSEQHLVDNFLRNFMNTLPPGSSWLGITRLQSRDAWRRESATIAYCEFQEAAERRTGNGELNYFRLWCFDDDDRFRTTEDIMRRQYKKKFEVRFCVGKDLDDISIIWVPAKATEKAARIHDIDSPITEIKAKPKAFQPLCAIKFNDVRGGRELEELTICTPETDEFKRLSIYFQNAWQLAKPLPKRDVEVPPTDAPSTAAP